MAFSLTSEVEFLKKLPAYAPVLKAVLKSQIQLLVNQLSEYGGEESLFMTASLSDGTLTHIGSRSGQMFLKNHDEFKSKFLHFCLGEETMAVSSRDLQMQGCKKASKKHKATKRKHSNPYNSPSTKKNKTHGVLNEEDDSGDISDVSSNRTKYKMSENNDSGKCCPLSGVSSLEFHALNKETNNKNSESVTIEESYCSDADSKLPENSNDKSTEDSDSLKDKADERYDAEEVSNTDEADDDFQEENIIIKVEPHWECDNEEDTTNFVDRTEKEESSVVSDPSTSSEKSAVNPSEIFTSDDFIRFNRPRAKATRKSQSLATKYSAIVSIESGEKSRSQVAKDYRLSQSTLSMWLKNAKQIKNDYLCCNLPPDRKRARRSQYEDVERSLLEWYKAAKGSNFDVTIEHITEKADQLARSLGYSPEMFTCSRSWISRFKLRNGLLKKKSARPERETVKEADQFSQNVSDAVERQNSEESELQDEFFSLFSKTSNADS